MDVRLKPQHFLNFFPLPQGHGELRPGLSLIWPPSQLVSKVSSAFA